jgi:hypothetical protein
MLVLQSLGYAWGFEESILDFRVLNASMKKRKGGRGRLRYCSLHITNAHSISDSHHHEVQTQGKSQSHFSCLSNKKEQKNQLGLYKP